MKRRDAMKRWLAGIGVAIVVAMLGAVVQRVTLVLLVAVAAPWLLWTALKAPARMLPRCALIAAVALVLAAVPVDIWIFRTGERAAGFDEVIWGLMLPPSGAGAGSHRGLAAGCAVPLLNRTRYAFWISY
jgi:hypothetical protein